MDGLTRRASSPTGGTEAASELAAGVPLLGASGEAGDGGKTRVSFSEMSPLGGTLVGYLDIMRVYAKPDELESVRKATENKFGKESTATKISF